MLRRVLLCGFLTVIGAGTACIPGTRPPDAPLRGTLRPGSATAPPPTTKAGPLQVVFATPQGETLEPSEVSLVFNKPMRPLGLAPAEPPPPASISPRLAGSWQWIGSRALRFNARGGLPLATSFRVELPADTTALDGSRLAEPYVLTFTTPRPRLVDSYPADGATGVLPSATFTLAFNMPVSSEEVARAVTVLASAPIPYRVRAEQEEERFTLEPTQKLPAGSAVRVVIDGSLRGLGGELTAGKTTAIQVQTLGQLKSNGFACAAHPLEHGACDPRATDITLELTNAVPAKTVTSAVQVTPRPTGLEVTAEGGGEADTRFIVRGEFLPGTVVQLRLPPGTGVNAVRDEAGQRLAAEVKTTLRFGDLPPAVSHGARGIYWPPGLARKLPVSVLNATGVTLRAAARAEEEVLASLVRRESTNGVIGKELVLESGKLNEVRRSTVLLDDVLPARDVNGPVLVQSRYGPELDGKPRTVTTEFQFTDIGAATRVGIDGAAVWLTSLTTGRALPGARVDVYRIPGEPNGRPQRLATGTVDSSGVAWLPFPLTPTAGAPLSKESRPETLAVVTRNGDDWSYHGLDRPASPRPIGMVFDERGIYRPGETVWVAGVFRIPGAHKLMTPEAGKRVSLRAFNAEGQEFASWAVTLSSYGTFWSSVRLPDDIPLGRARLEAELDGGIERDWLMVDQYVPDETRISVVPDRNEYQRGDAMLSRVQGTYLYGGPMAARDATIVVSRQSGYYSVPGLELYTTSDVDAVSPGGTVARARVKLDPDGVFRLPAGLTLPGQVGTETVVCSVEIEDANRRVKSTSTSVTVHPAEVYVALRSPDQWSVEPGEVVEVEALVVTPKGERRALPVHMEWSLRRRGESGNRTDKLLAQCDARPGAEPASCKFAVPRGVPESGDQVLVRGSTSDAHGNRVTAAYERAITLPPRSEPPPVPGPAREPTLQVHHKERSYKPGETVRLSIESPFPTQCTALLTVERQGISQRRVVQLAPSGTDTPIDLVVTPEMIPNVAISVVAIAGAQSRSTSTHIEVDPGSKELKVEVRPDSSSHAPGDSVLVEAVVTDASGKPVKGEVTLWAADEGSLQLAHYRTPEPVYPMYRNQAELIESFNSRDHLVAIGWLGSHRSRAPQVRMGATSVTPRRGDFRQTVVFAPGLLTDTAGRVRRRVKLPDALTTYRFMAFAVSDDRFGSGEAEVTTSKALMARPSLPRVIRAGDEFEGSVVISSQELPAGEVTVEAVARGLVSTGASRRVLQLAPGLPTEVRFPFRADRPGKVLLRVDATAKGAEEATDGVDLSSAVVAPTAAERAAIYGETATSVAERIADLSSVRPDTGGISVRIATEPYVGVAEGMDQLLEYPYGCTEQTVSRMVPLLVVRDLARALGVTLPEGRLEESGTEGRASGELAVVLQQAAQRVLSNQRRDGGFGFWPGSADAHRWISTYALWGLSEARRRGIAVPRQALDKARSFVSSRPGAGEQGETAEWLANEAFVLDVLRAEGELDPARANALFAAREKMPVFARALLLHAFAKAPDGGAFEPKASTLAQELESVVRLDGPNAHVVTGPAERFGALLDSDTRTTAMVLRALVASNAKHPLIPRLLSGLLAARNGGRWRTTQEAAWALLAIDAYRQASPPRAAPVRARVFVGPELLLERSFEVDDKAGVAAAEMPMAKLVSHAGQPMTFGVEGRGTLYYEAQLSFTRRTLPEEPVEAGLFVDKSIRPVDGETGAMSHALPGDPAHVKLTAGQVVLCEITVVTPSSRLNVVVDDPLPGGLEAVSFRLGRGGEWLARLDAAGPETRRELRDDRVVFFVDRLPAGIATFRYLARATSIGTFVQPPTRAEEMYVPETYGATAAGRVQVVGR